MRIVYFDFTNNFGGAPQAMVHLAKRLAALHDVHIVDAYGRCEPYHQAIMEAGLPYHVLVPEARYTYIGGSGFKRGIAFIRQFAELNRIRKRLSSLILKIEPDVIWVINEKSLTMVALNTQLRCYPTAIYLLGWATPDQVDWWLRWLMKYKTSAVISVSTATTKQLTQAGIPAKKIFLGSMTIDVENVSILSEKPSGSLPGQLMSPKLLMLAARPERAKGHVTAYKAVARLKRAGYNPALWMTGKTAVGHTDAFIDELNCLSTELNISENVFYLGWQDNMPAIIRAADICILPSHTEGLPRSILESMILKKPVIATPVGGIGDVVKDGSTGFVMPVDDDVILATHVQKLIENPLLKDLLVTTAYDFMMKHFHPAFHTAEIEKIFIKMTEN